MQAGELVQYVVGWKESSFGKEVSFLRFNTLDEALNFVDGIADQASEAVWWNIHKEVSQSSRKVVWIRTPV